MANETIEKSSNLILGIIFIAIFLVVMLLALVIVINSMGVAYIGVNGNPLTTVTVTNETDAYLNQTGYNLSAYSLGLFGYSNPTITEVWNNSNSKLLLSGNYTLTGSTLYNATATTFSKVNVSYTYQYYTNTSAPYAGNNIQNNLLSMVLNFFALMPTVGTILAVCILIVAIVWLVFYVRRMKNENGDFKG